MHLMKLHRHPIVRNPTKIYLVMTSQSSKVSAKPLRQRSSPGRRAAEVLQLQLEGFRAAWRSAAMVAARDRDGQRRSEAYLAA